MALPPRSGVDAARWLRVAEKLGANVSCNRTQLSGRVSSSTRKNLSAVTVGLCFLALVGCGGSARPAPTRPSRTAASQPSALSDPAPGRPNAASTPGSSTLGSSTPGSAAGGTFATAFGPQFDASKPFCKFSDEKARVAHGIITVSYPAGSTAPSAGPPHGGAQICEPFAGGPRATATLTYQVKLPIGFQFVKGGKLPGLYGGSEPFSGGKHSSSGWSMRVMWRKGGAGEVYAYIAGGRGYGEEYGKGNFTFLADGRFHTLTERVTINRPGLSDGSVTLSYDGVTAISQTGLSITNTNTPIDGLFFSTFFGGHDKSWAPKVDQHIEFAGFNVV